MASELVNLATNDKLTETDWMKNIQICELVAHDYRQAKDVIKAIKKRLGSKRTSTQLFAVVLLEMLMNNIGESIHKQVIDTGLLPVLVKIVKKSGQSDLPVREKIFLLLDATQTSLGGASGRFPQYYHAYYELVSSGVKFPQRPQTVTKNNPISGMTKNKSPGSELHASQHANSAPQAEQQIASESSIIQKADAAVEVLREVLDAVDSQHPDGAKDEFTLDLVEQCSFQKQRIMHLAVTSRDEKVISQAIELNEQLEKVLTRHDALISGWSTSISNHLSHGEAEEEEAEQLFQRIRKGKARAPPEIEDGPVEGHLNLGLSPSGERMNPPSMKPLILEPKQENNTVRTAVAIPPPPSKHVEREKFFQENKLDGSALIGHMRGRSLHSRSASSSQGSIDFRD